MKLWNVKSDFNEIERAVLARKRREEEHHGNEEKLRMKRRRQPVTRKRHWTPPWPRLKKTYGKGCGDAPGGPAGDGGRRHSPPDLWPWMPLWASAACPVAGSLRFMAPSPPARPLWLCTSWPRPKKSGAGKWPLWTRSTPWTQSMPPLWGWTSIPCWSLSRTPASRLWRLPTPWCAPAL